MRFEQREIELSIEAIDDCKKNLNKAVSSTIGMNLPKDAQLQKIINNLSNDIGYMIDSTKNIKENMNHLIERMRRTEELNHSLASGFEINTTSLSTDGGNNRRNIHNSTSFDRDKYNLEFDLEDVYAARDESIEAYFQYFDKGTGRFGVNQGFFYSTISYDLEEYQRLLNICEEKYNMSAVDACKLMEYMDSIGVCTYASACDVLVVDYAKKPEEFYNKFGFDLYIKDSLGNIQINSGEMLIDMFLKVNSRGGLSDNPIVQTEYFKDGTTKYSITEEALNKKNTWINQAYVENNDAFYVYAGYSEERVFMGSALNDYDMSILQSFIKSSVNTSKTIRLCIGDSDDDISTCCMLTNVNDGTMHSFEDGGHCALVIGYNDDGILVSTWGDEYLIKYSDIKNNRNYVDLLKER